SGGEGQPLRPGLDRRLLDSQAPAAHPGDLPRAGARPPGAVRPPVRRDDHPRRQGPREPPRRPVHRDPRRGPSPVTETVRTKRWTRLEYERLIDLAVFGPGERLELLGGQLLVREPQGRPRATGIRLVARALRAVFGSGWSIEAQLPVALDEESEPEPDIAVVVGEPRDYLGAHPSHPALVVEVALASLALDRGGKASLYARAGVADY